MTVGDAVAHHRRFADDIAGPLKQRLSAAGLDPDTLVARTSPGSGERPNVMLLDIILNQSIKYDDARRGSL
ncbi:MAG TPA: hypothetical protein VGC51_02520 [Hansschlegelia sp.]